MSRSLPFLPHRVSLPGEIRNHPQHPVTRSRAHGREGGPMMAVQMANKLCARALQAVCPAGRGALLRSGGSTAAPTGSPRGSSSHLVAVRQTMPVGQSTTTHAWPQFRSFATEPPPSATSPVASTGAAPADGAGTAWGGAAAATQTQKKPSYFFHIVAATATVTTSLAIAQLGGPIDNGALRASLNEKVCHTCNVCSSNLVSFHSAKCR